MALSSPVFAPTRIPTIARAAALTALGIAAGIAVAVLVLAVVATRLFDFQVLTVRSDSMAPAIRSGDLIVVKPAAIDGVSAGDIVLFASGGDAIPTVHRVAGVNTVEVVLPSADGGPAETLTEHRLVTQGDANPLPDASEVTAANLRGEVWFTVPGGGAIVGMPMHVLLLGIAGLTTVAWIGWEFLRKRGDA